MALVPKTPDHTRSVLTSLVAMLLVLAFVTVGLEAVHSENTTELVAVIVGVMATQIVPQLKTLASTKRVEQAMNGGLDDRIERAVRRCMERERTTLAAMIREEIARHGCWMPGAAIDDDAGAG
ncbi:MAG: hypothetical protein C4523_19640 [Myxococcales bacterium]|nr:MAG: hypothetical protein C4523_19640 [Myxococcales bacterium]